MLQTSELIDLLNWNISLSTASTSYKLNYFSNCKHNKNSHDESRKSSFDETHKKYTEFKEMNNPALLIRANFFSSDKKKPCFVTEVTIQSTSREKYRDLCNLSSFSWTDKNASKLKAYWKAFSRLCICSCGNMSCLITGVFWWKGQFITVNYQDLYFSLTSKLLGAYG